MSNHSNVSDQSSAETNGLPSPPSSPPEPPAFPYVEGAKFVVHKHEPPTMSEMGYDEEDYCLPGVSGEPSHLEWCLANPPAPGVRHPDTARDVEIAQIIRCGKTCGAQVVLTADGLVAKIYDPLYYDFCYKANVTSIAEVDYVTEVGAYSDPIGTSIQGDLMPTYHGSWTLDLPIIVDGVDKIREARLIMMEYIPGAPMQDLDPRRLTDQERENIMIKFIEADVDLRFLGIEHGDFEPRNVILSIREGSDTYETNAFRLCIIDYARCALSAVDGCGYRGPSPEYYNPLFYWPGQFWYSDWGWLQERNQAKDWMWKIWGDGGRDRKYVPVERDPRSRQGNPKWPDIKTV
ncbi:hypothetical protein DE146DRAFT_642820 [Phaeosphaeria sp. MPI-PUGE-AT-0046c]|nr:hypothetical protein DE146DRAFT_642820 [Phaeosphaeria sp. MPI-PUGE-AT-0046c]